MAREAPRVIDRAAAAVPARARRPFSMISPPRGSGRATGAGEATEPPAKSGNGTEAGEATAL